MKISISSMLSLKEKFKEWIRKQPCLICGQESTHAHYTKRGYGGMGMKGHDLIAHPLCPVHHGEQHEIGIASFKAKYKNIDFDWLVTQQIVDFLESLFDD